MIQLIYSSAAKQPFSDKQLTELLAHARINNARRSVTGILLYDRGSFLQVLEGDEKVVTGLFDSIKKDPRHTNVVELLRIVIPERTFSEWSMGFASMDGLDRSSVPGYSDFLDNLSEPQARGHGNAALRILCAFREGRLRRHVDR